jgi:hypothetical protein
MKWWERASIASIFGTIILSLILFRFVYRSNNPGINQQRAMLISLYLIIPTIICLTIAFVNFNILTKMYFHLFYAEFAIIFLGFSDYELLQELNALHTEISNNNAEIFRNTILHVDLPLFFSCTLLILITIGCQFSQVFHTEMEIFVAGALTFEFAAANIASAINEARLKI